MKTVLLLLYFKEEAYGRRLLYFLMGKKHPSLHPELVTSREKIQKIVGATTKHTVILTDDQKVYEDETKNVVLLTGEQSREQQKIFQFQCAEAIYEELIAQLGLQIKVQVPVREREKSQGVILLFTLDGCGVTATSVLLSQYLGQRGKCLYFSLAGFPVYYGSEFTKEPDFQKQGLGELLFCDEKEDMEGQLQSLIQKFGSADLLSPPAHFKDILDCSPEDWRKLFYQLKKQGGYDTIVVEIGQLFESVMELLELGDQILIFAKENAFGKVRKAAFRRYCQMEQKEQLLNRVTYHAPPEDAGEWEHELAQQSLAEWGGNSPIMQEMESLLTDERKEEENVCIYEDLG